MGLSSLPHSSDLLSLHEWSETVAPFDIKNIVAYVRSQKQDLRSKAKIESRNLFMDPTKRGLWLQRTFGVRLPGVPTLQLILQVDKQPVSQMKSRASI